MKHINRFSLLCFLIMNLWVQNSYGVNPDEILSDPSLEQRARNISSVLRCMVCQNQSIDDSDADLARDLRLLVRERLSAGDTDATTIDYIVARYGEFVLLKPRFGIHTLILWLAVPLILGGAILWLYNIHRKQKKSNKSVSLSDEETAELKKYL